MAGKQDAAKRILEAPYSRVLIPDSETGTYTARLLEFPGCVAQGDTPTEAYRRLERSAETWIEAAQGQGQAIPQPAEEQTFSGRVLVRFPKSLHQRATEAASRDATSLNQFVVAAVAEQVGLRSRRTDLVAVGTANTAGTVSSANFMKVEDSGEQYKKQATERIEKVN